MGLVLAAIGLAAAGGDDSQATEIATLIGNLGNPEFGVRDAAEKQLLQFSWRAVPALKKALENQDPEIAQRAERVLGHLTDATPKQQDLIRQKAEAAFRDGRYEDAAELYGLLAYQRRSTIRNRIWLGHACQLADQWQDAADAYRLALEQADFLCMHPEISAERRGGIWDGHLRERESNRGRPVPLPPPRIRNEGETAILRDQADRIRLLVGLIERDEVGDLEVAAATFAGFIDDRTLIERPVQELLADYEAFLRRRMAGEDVERKRFTREKLTYPLRFLDELAVTQEWMGDTVTALATWERIRLTRLLYGTESYSCDLEAVDRLLRSLGPADPPPQPGAILVMSPETESYALDFGDPESMTTAYTHPFRPGMAFWRFAFLPPPGREFAALEITCEVEQSESSRRWLLECWLEGEDSARRGLGWVNWPKEQVEGRFSITRRLEVPFGDGVVHILGRGRQGESKLHWLTVRPSFRSRTAKGATPSVVPWIQTEALPLGGVLTCDGEELVNPSDYSRFPAGLHTFAYRVPGRTDGKQVVATLSPSAWYGIFINLDSPFAVAPTNLRHFAEFPSEGAKSVVRLSDGRWLLAYNVNEGYGYDKRTTIMLSASRDLANWDKPWPFPRNSVFENKAPALVMDKQGTIWLAWSSTRVDIGEHDAYGSSLWLASSRDGRTWSRPLLVTGERGSHLGGVCWAQSPTGKYWMFAGNQAASADAPGDIRRLSPISVHGEDGSRIWSPRVAWDSRNRMHMVFPDPYGAVWATASDDGKQWTEPKELIGEQEKANAGNPQLIADGGRMAMVYGNVTGAWLQRLRPGADGDSLEKAGPPIKIASHLIPLGGSLLTIAEDGRVLLMAGSNTVRLLHGKLAEILQAPPPPQD